ncbi:MAG: penicillin-binding transpeptidase domain-containing protein, partial [Thermodesulfovibrionales bacterium]
YENGYITKDEYESGLDAPLPTKPHYRKFDAPYFVEHLRQQLELRYGDAIYTSGLRIHSTIDRDMQNLAEDALKKGISDIEKRVKKGVQGAIVAIDLKDGSIKAMVGGTDYWETQFNRATMALRQPGSAFKPFVYALAIKEGLSPDYEILDEQISFPGSKPNTVWSPKNYDNEYKGYVTLKTALALSLNTATVRLAHNLGVNNIIDFAKQCGIKSPLQPYLPIALGASDVTPLELTLAYAVFATGRRIEPVVYTRITDNRGMTIEEGGMYYTQKAEVLSPEETDEIRQLLRAVVTSGTAQKAMELKREVFGKTGTTNDFSDAWFIGFDSSLVVGVWVGRDNHKPIGNKEAGARAALPIWIDFMKGVKNLQRYRP